MKDKNKKILLVILVIVIIIIILIYFINQNLKTNSSDIKSVKDIDTSINTDDDDEDVDWNNLSKYELTSNNLTITEPGSYTLTGDINGTVIINVVGDVKLIMDNVSIKPTSGAGIIIEQADNVLIFLADGTTNTIIDTEIYSYDDTDIDGAIYSKDDLIFDGTGTLNITSNYNDGIVSKDDLKIINGTYNITSNDDGIRGKDSVYIQNGNFNITSAGDGIKSTNDTDTEKGYILIEDGSFKITSELDGMQAETKLVINNGTFDIITGGGSNNSSTSSSWGNWGRGTYSKNTSTASAKGLKANSNIVINNGTFTFNTSDDSIHSNDYVGISNGNLNITSGDDGIHADTKLIIDGGSINIIKSYEGLESSEITLNGGNINIVASDDGINVAGGNDASAMNRPGENNYNSNSNNLLTINAGKIIVDAIGDGIDVNGSAYIYGGEVYINGPTDNGNGILDYDREFIVDGGTLIGAGSNGMLQSISSTKQYNVMITFNKSYSANSKVQIVDSNNNEITTYTPSKTFSSIIISSSLLKENETYTIKVNDTKYTTFTTTSLSTNIGSSGGMMPDNGGRGNPRR